MAIEEKEVLEKIKSFGKSLKKELKSGLKKSTQEAVKSCNLKAPELADKAGNDEIKIGRVSLKNRNPNNTRGSHHRPGR